jgi:hypothetical protein
MSITYPNEAITIRTATDRDRTPLARLAQRDSRPVPGGPLLIAESEGSIRAALALDTGAVIADPFHRTRPLVDLLRARATQAAPRDRGLRIVASSPALATRAA